MPKSGVALLLVGYSGLCWAVACKRRSPDVECQFEQGTGSCWPIRLMRGRTFPRPIAGILSTICAKSSRARSWSIPMHAICITSCREARRSATA